MSSADFNIDSLLDDINDADFMTPRGGSDYSASKHVPHPPKAEKPQVNVRLRLQFISKLRYVTQSFTILSLIIIFHIGFLNIFVQVYSTNPKSKFAVFPVSLSSPSSARQSDSTYYDSNSCGFFGDETNYRSSNKPLKQTTNSYLDNKNSYDCSDKYSTTDSSRSASKGNGSSLYSKSQQCNDTSVDRLLSMLSQSHSPPDTSPSTPIPARTYSTRHSEEGTTKVLTHVMKSAFGHAFFCLKHSSSSWTRCNVAIFDLTVRRTIGHRKERSERHARCLGEQERLRR